MGCDIHAYIDYEYPRFSRETPYMIQWADVFLLRDYDMFGFLAGVRGDGPCLIAPRGLPQHMSWSTLYEATLMVVDEGQTGEHTCTREQAEKWGGRYFDEEKTMIHHPDWHTPSWLTTKELGQVLNAYKKEAGDCPADFLAAHRAMEALDECGMKAKFVFWFDC